MPDFQLATLDVVIVVVYLVGVLAHGLWVSRDKESSSDYFLAGRRLGWFLVGFSLFASNMSGASFVGLMGASYDHGLVVFNYEWTATVVLILFGFILLPSFMRSGIFTVPQFLQHRFDGRARTAYSVFLLLAIMFVDTAGALYAGGLVISSIFPMFSLWEAVGILAVVAGVYTILGGLKAVVVTDTVQAILLILGAMAIFVIGLDRVGGWEAMVAELAELDDHRMRLIQPADHGFLPWTGLLGVMLLGFYYWTLNQFIVQRALGARGLDQGRKGALFAGFLKLPNLFLMIVPGVFAILLYPGLPDPDLVFPTLAFDLLPVGLRGLILTALIAAVMSSLDSALNAAATLVTMDFVRPLRPRTTDRALVSIGRVVTGVAMIVGAVYAPMIQTFPSLFEYFQSVLSYLVPSIVAVYFGGIFIRRLNGHGAFWTIVMGIGMGVPLFILKEVTGTWTAVGLPDLHFTLMSVIMFALSFLVLVGVSLATAPPEEGRVRETMFRLTDLGRDLDRSGPWYLDARLQAAALLVLTATTIWSFR
jgi:solute:Na+ symporter, SSS family